jgi:uncharacterized protein
VLSALLVRLTFAGSLCAACLAGIALAQQVPWQADFDGALKQREFTKAFAIAKDAADRNETHGKYLHAVMTRDGSGTLRDTSRARQLFAELAESGHTLSQLALAELLRAGIGGPKDLEGAALQYRRAADQGNVVAMLQLARLHRLSDFKDRDDTRAFEWALKSANAGHAPAFGLVISS